MSAVAPLWPPAADEAYRVARRTFAATDDTSILGRWIDWPRRRTARAARSSLVGIAVVVAALRLPGVVDGEWDNFQQLLWYQAVTLGWVLLAGLVVRTITPRHVISYWLLGIFFAGTVVDGLGAVLDDHATGNAFTAGVVPVLEEFVKLLPILWYLLTMRWARRGVGAIDLALLGMAIGGGFAVYEDMLWGRAFASGFEGMGIVFPSMTQDPFVAAGHLVWTGCAALGVGFLHLHRRRLWAWIIGPLLIAVPVLDHAVINYRGDEYDAMRSLLLGGRMPSILLLAGMVLALGLELGIVSRSQVGDHLYAPASAQALLTTAPPPVFSVRASPRQFQRARNAVVFRWHLGREVGPAALLEVATTNAAMNQDA